MSDKNKQELVAAIERAMAQMEYDKPKHGGYQIGNRPAATRQEMLENWTYRVLKGTGR